MIVLDGSGSMWGQIDGVPKLTIARDVLHKVLPTVPATTELGLVAYGHREKGNCADIELVVPPATGTADAIATAADNMKFLGKTPLSDAVQFAAEQLRYTEDKATVVLITDGIETCDADPCALGKALEEQGIDFTVHVVGFGLSAEEGAQVACLAENTGGLYLQADNPDELTTALEETVVAAPPPSFRFEAVDQDGNVLQNRPLDWRIIGSDGNEVASAAGRSDVSSPLAPGDYQVLVSGEEVSGGLEFSIADGDGSRTFDVPVELQMLHAALKAPKQVAQGAQFEVTWEGPNEGGDYVTIVETGAREGAYGSYAYTVNGNPAEVTAAAEPGTYEVRYVYGATDKTLASVPIEVVAADVSVSAPESVGEGATFEVNWTGPANNGDYITIVPIGADEGAYLDYAYAVNGNPSNIVAPEEAGDYEVRYVLGEGDKTLAAAAIKVGPVSGGIVAPESVMGGAAFEVSWKGPNNDRDYITIVKEGADEGSYTDYFYTKNANPGEINLPETPGRYEVRYVLNVSNRTLVSVPISVK